MTKRDYYEVLGIEDRSASQDDIKKAYRKIALQYHPDRNPNNPEAEERFKEAAEAYAVLGDSEKRKLYDAYGHDGVKGRGESGFRTAQDVFDQFSDIFGTFFGFSTEQRGARGFGPEPGADFRYDLVITFEQAARGGEIEIDITRPDTCEDCHGSGAKDGMQPDFVACPVCGGRGQVIRTEGFLRIMNTCSRCVGRGGIIANPCPTCLGEGRIRANKRIKVRVPAGVDTGSRLRLIGEGESGLRGGRRGDLYVVIHVQEHKFFYRHGNDIYCRVPIAMVQAALGDEIEVPTLDGPKKIKIPAGTQPGEAFKLKGLGVPDLRLNGIGDQIVEVEVQIPKKISEKGRQLLEEFASIEKSREDGIITKIWKFFEGDSPKDAENKEG